jgi:leucyl-tRNA synthetase
MLWSRRVPRIHQTFLRYTQRWFTTSRCSQHKLTPPESKVDFLGIEKEWQENWNARGTKIQEERDPGDLDHPLALLYMKDIRKPTIMGTLQLAITKERVGTLQSIIKKKSILSIPGGTTMIEQILYDFDTPISWSEPKSKHESLRLLIQKYGKDVVRTSILFSRGPGTTDNLSADQTSITNTQQWFERVWKAVEVAHSSYTHTCAHEGGVVDIERNDPDVMDDFMDSQLDTIQSYVHIPPRNPNISEVCRYEDDSALWFASQEAILAMTRRTEVVDLEKVHLRLSNLANSILIYDEMDRQNLGLHYHSTRILLSLVAVFAPSFAEAGWRALHYGHDQWRNEESRETIEQEKSNCGNTAIEEENFIRDDFLENG